MRGTKRALMLVLAAVLIGCLVCVPCAIALEGDHDCCGEDCPVCAFISICENVVKALSILMAVILLAVATLFVASVLRNHIGFCHTFSPVNLKVKLSN